MIIYCLSMPSFLSHRKCSELKLFHFWVPAKCSVTKHTPARVWGEVLGGFFAHEVNVCLLERTLIQWSDLPCTSLQKLPRLQCLWCQNVMQFLGTERILIFQNSQNKAQMLLTSIRPSISLKLLFRKMLEPRNAGTKECQYSDPAFYHHPPNFTWAFSRQAGVFLEGRSDFFVLTLALCPAMSWSSSVWMLVLLRTSKSSVSKSESSSSSGVWGKSIQAESNYRFHGSENQQEHCFSSRQNGNQWR